ncbi:helicase [bacterium MSK18_59]|nr:helicase [bacterium MSK18_59]DAW65767.1 MAG TPA: replicative helicase [Bacteriophage sp.]
MAEKKKLTPYQEEKLKCAKQVKEYKVACEANIVSIFYKKPELMYDYQLKLEDFSENTWRVYWQIAYDIIVKEKKSVLDDITVGLYLEKHSKLKQKYDEYGGYDTIDKATEYIKTSNISGYVNELKKWETVIRMIASGFPVTDRIKEFVDMSLDEIYKEYDALLNHIFINAEEDVMSYSLSDGIYDLIEQLNEGIAVGLPYDNMPTLTKETGGQLPGNITLVGGLSNMGKTTLTRTMLIPSAVKYGERLVILVNEEGKAKWQRELIVWVANNIYKTDLQKFVVRDGKFSDEVKELLYKCADWIAEKSENNMLTIIPFARYETQKAIRVIKKYASLGVKYFILDTYKADAGSRSDRMWLDMQQNMVDIYDTVKAEGGKNVHITITFQLAKSSARQRFYSQDNIGMAKSIIDPASTCLMLRDVFEDEYTGEKNALKVYRLDGKNNKSKIPVKLDHDKHYQLIFIVKNREGAANSIQIVCEHDMSRNLLKEVGFTSVPVDF